jgi:hypothetical protein
MYPSAQYTVRGQTCLSTSGRSCVELGGDYYFRVLTKAFEECIRQSRLLPEDPSFCSRRVIVRITAREEHTAIA